MSILAPALTRKGERAGPRPALLLLMKGGEMVVGRIQGKLVAVALSELGEHFSQYRTRAPRAVDLMKASLERYGQISPIVVSPREGKLELVDGFKRVVAARGLEDFEVLSARVLDLDDTSAKAALYLLNRAGGGVGELEEARIVHSLVREDGLSQQEVAELLRRHKSWVCRRLALVEKLSASVRGDLEVGLITPTAGREISRLPQGNQQEVVDAVRRESLNSGEIRLIVDAFLACGKREEQEFVIRNARETLARRQGGGRETRDPRLSPSASRVARRMGFLTEELSRMESWLRGRGRSEVCGDDPAILEPLLAKLGVEAHRVAEAAEDFIGFHAT